MTILVLPACFRTSKSESPVTKQVASTNKANLRNFISEGSRHSITWEVSPGRISDLFKRLSALFNRRFLVRYFSNLSRWSTSRNSFRVSSENSKVPVSCACSIDLPGTLSGFRIPLISVFVSKIKCTNRSISE